MELKIFNTLTNKVEEFKPIDEKQVKMYSCGPTVYKNATIGNVRTAIMENTLENILKYNGYDVKHVMNITDVGHLVSDGDEGEDKMEKSAKEENKSPQEIAEFYKQLYFNDLERLNIQKPEIICPATSYIKQMIEFVEKLIENGYAYVTDTAVYFDVSKLDKYPNLTNQKQEDKKAGVRIEVDPNKRNHQDFALWIKANENHLQKWESPWYEMGFPGWHIECSTMSLYHLGKQFDIHTGGIDLVPTHHENEIAQSIGANGVIPANYWVHGEFLLIDNKKMSKSLGNVYLIQDIIDKGFNPLAYKYFVFQGHYKTKINFTWEAISSANTALEKLYKSYNENIGLEENPDIQNELDEIENNFHEAINDDMNMPKALACVWQVAKFPTKAKNIALMLEKMDTVLKLNIANNVLKDRDNTGSLNNIPDEVIHIANTRLQAKKEKNYGLADELRNKIQDMGYVITDTSEGFELSKK